MKRSGQIALVLMGATAVGASSYALTPSRTECTQPGGPAARPPLAGTPAAPQGNQPCRETRRWWSSSGSSSGYSGSSAWRRSTQVNTSTALHSPGGAITSAGHSSTSTPTSAARGGFGSTGHGFSSGG
jgi:hypothetical protein